MLVNVEIPIDTLASAQAAFAGGANRLEICSALAVGGLTPTVGLVKAIAHIRHDMFKASNCQLFVMIRPRVSDFTYSALELQSMLDDIQEMKKIEDVSGFVFGCLKSNGEVDRDANTLLLEACKPLPATFHRAFDFGIAQGQNSEQMLNDIISLGFHRLLTSGGKLTAIDGITMISRLQNYVISKNPNFIIMPGSGVTVANAKDIVSKTNCREIHSSCKASTAQKLNDDSVADKLLQSFGSCTETKKEIVEAFCKLFID